MNIKTIVRALRCSVTPGEKDCVGCRYRVLNEVQPGLPIPMDVEIDGVLYWECCDVDLMAMDAAEALEVLARLKSD